MHLHAKALNQQPYLRRSPVHNASVSSKNDVQIQGRVSRSSSETRELRYNSQSNLDMKQKQENKNIEEQVGMEIKSDSDLSKHKHASFSTVDSSLSTTISLIQQNNNQVQNHKSQSKISSRLSSSLFQQPTLKPLESNHHDMKEFFRAIKFNVLTKKRGKGGVMPQLQPQASLKPIPYSLVNIPKIDSHRNSFQTLPFQNNQISQQTSNEGAASVSLSYRPNQGQQNKINSQKNQFNQQDRFFMPQPNFSRNLGQKINNSEQQSNQQEFLETRDYQPKKSKQQSINDRIRKVMNFSLVKELNDFVYQLSKPEKSISKSSILKFPSLTPKLSPKSSMHGSAAAEDEDSTNQKQSGQFSVKLESSHSLPSVFPTSNASNSLCRNNSLVGKKKQVHFIIDDSQFDNKNFQVNGHFL